MTHMLIAILTATIGWFVLAAILFFNPIVDRIYRTEESHEAVKNLPQNPVTIGKILLAVLVQCIAWAYVYTWIKSAFPTSLWMKGLLFGSIIVLIKLVPRDIDRLLLTTYPSKRMLIEFIVGIPCAFIVSFTFAYML